MKKSILAMAVVLGATTTFAQDLTSKKGENYLPEAGDWAIGIDAVPFLNYVGNFFGKTNDNNYANGIWDFNNPNMVITGKYFVEDGLAYRAGIRLGFGSDKGTEMVADRAFTGTNPWPAAPSEVENTYKMGATNIALTAGMEWRKGTTRLQGFYGAEIGFGISSTKNTYTYGNALTASTATPVVDVTAADDMGGNIMVVQDGQGNNQDARILTDKSGMNFSLGLRGFIGAEYFFLPKMSLGGEFGWGLVLGINGKNSTTYEVSGITAAGTDEQVEEITMEGGKSSSFGVDTQNVNPLFGPIGRLNLTFHF